MKLVMEMGPGYGHAVRRLGRMGQAIIDACAEGLEIGAKIAAGHVVSEHLSGQDLKRRTGDLARAVDGWMEGDTEAVIGVRENSAVDRYAWILGDEQKTITPKNSKFLAIPIGEGLTSAGAARFKSPREVEGGFFIRSKKGQLLFGYKKGKRGKFRPLFVLVKSVLVQGTGSLYDGVMESMDDMGQAIERAIDRRLGAA